MRIALLGTGAMGAGMARSAARAGHDVTAWNRTKATADPLADDGIRVAATVADAVADAEAVVTMLYDADSVLGIVDELTGALPASAVWLQSSTVGPAGIARIATAAGPDVRLLDAPMLGTKAPAEQGKLVPLVSGPGEFVAAVQPVLDAVGARTVVAGPELGQASVLKLVCNAWVLNVVSGVAQSVKLAQQSGLDPALFLQAVQGGAMDAPYVQLKGNAMIDGDWTPSFGVDGGLKDARLILEELRGAGVFAGLMDQIVTAFETASDAGHGSEDLAAVYFAF